MEFLDNIPIVSPDREHHDDESRRSHFTGLTLKLTNRTMRAIRIRMPGGAECTVGGEALIGALARGGQPVEES